MSDSKRPIIGITTYRQQAKSGVWDLEASFLPATYIESVTNAGGIAVLLPPQPADTGVAERVLDGLDGVLFAGGRDVNPELYDQPRGEHTDEPDRARDEWEFALMSAAIQRDIPLLAICRGMQVLNVALGGTLHQHLPDVVGHTDYQRGGGEYTTVALDIEPESALSKALGGVTKLTNSVYHHQSLDRVGAGLTVSARTGEGVIEGVDIDDMTFGLGVQCHPEVTGTRATRLFESFVEAAHTYRSTHA